METFSGAIINRYNELSREDCCLSCGHALSHARVLPGHVCVDLGSGKGHDVLRMALLTGDKGRVVGIDLSEGMMETAMENARRLKITHVGFIRSPLEKLPLDDDMADVVISNCTINHSLDQESVWLEIARILKPGGHFAVSDIYALEQVPAVFASDPVAVSECWAGAVTKEEYMKNILSAGFVELEMMEESRPYQKGQIQVASFTIRGKKPAK